MQNKSNKETFYKEYSIGKYTIHDVWVNNQGLIYRKGLRAYRNRSNKSLIERVENISLLNLLDTISFFHKNNINPKKVDLPVLREMISFIVERDKSSPCVRNIAYMLYWLYVFIIR